MRRLLIDGEYEWVDNYEDLLNLIEKHMGSDVKEIIEEKFEELEAMENAVLSARQCIEMSGKTNKELGPFLVCARYFLDDVFGQYLVE